PERFRRSSDRRRTAGPAIRWWPAADRRVGCCPVRSDRSAGSSASPTRRRRCRHRTGTSSTAEPGRCRTRTARKSDDSDRYSATLCLLALNELFVLLAVHQRFDLIGFAELNKIHPPVFEGGRIHGFG